MRIGPIHLQQLAAQEDVGGGGEIVAERELLVDDLDAVLARFDRLVEMDLLALHPERAVGRRKVAGDDLDQRRLAGAVVAHQPDDLTRLERKRHVVERVDGSKMLGDFGDFENGHSAPTSVFGATGSCDGRSFLRGRRR